VWTVNTYFECNRVPREVFQKWGAIVGRNMFDQNRNFKRQGFVIFAEQVARPKPTYTITFNEQVYEFSCMPFNQNPEFREKMGFKPLKRR
jgi:hypothetical protein